MRFVPGGTLEDRLRSEGTLPVDQVVDLGIQVAEALEAAHAAGVLHRDLKPENVLCAPDRRYVLTDFGLAKDLEVEESLRLSRTGQPMGTPGYWAPEQAFGLGGKATLATDVYLLGAVLYAALTGGAPIERETIIEMVVATRTCAPPPPSEVRPDLPAWLEAVVLRCLAKEPDDRYPSAAAVARALEAPTTGAQTPAPAGPPAWALVGGGAALLLALGVGAAIALGSTPPPPPPTARPPEATPTRTPAPPAPTDPAADAYAAGERLFRAGQSAEALASYRAAAELGHPEATLAAARMLDAGAGVSQDRVEAARLYRRAAESGNPAAMGRLGEILDEGTGGVPQDPAEGLRWIRHAAESGHPDSMFLFAGKLANGWGVRKDEALGFRWFVRAAEAGHANAMAYAGLMLMEGRGVPRDDAEALRWHRRSAEHGAPAGMLNLGSMLLHGRGAPRDLAEASRWLQRVVDEAKDPEVRAAARVLLQRVPASAE
jgi:TPR repeat protein